MGDVPVGSGQNLGFSRRASGRNHFLRYAADFWHGRGSSARLPERPPRAPWFQRRELVAARWLFLNTAPREPAISKNFPREDPADSRQRLYRKGFLPRYRSTA